MTFVAGRPYLAIPGPSAVPDRVLNAMHQASSNIYEGPLLEIVDTIYPDLLEVARTSGNVAIYIGNGHATWEASLSNVFSKGDKALVLATGRFGEGWGEAAAELGIDVEVLNFGRTDGISSERLEDKLKADRDHQFRAVLVVHTDTATTVRVDIQAVRDVLDKCAHPALLMVDCIASMACDRFEMDAWGVDVALAASQKGLMMPPGLGFIWFNEKAMSIHQTADLVTPYWNWTPRTQAPEFFRKFNGTAPTQHLYGLRESLDIILKEDGLGAVWKRHSKLARAVWTALDTWAKSGPIKVNVVNPKNRSNAVTSVSIGKEFGSKLRRWLEENTGVTLGIGLGMETPDDPNSDGFFRIAHMGHVNAHMTLGVLASIEAGLSALDVPHGSGAVEAAAQEFAAAQSKTSS